MNRRSFIKIGILTNVLVWSGLYIFDFRWCVRRILQQDTAGLKIAPESIDKFMIEADKEQFWRQFSLAKKFFISVHHSLEFMGSLGQVLPYYEKYLQYRNVITGHFLFSTDLFSQTYSPDRQIHYTGFMNPYKGACSNPFSNLRTPG